MPCSVLANGTVCQLRSALEIILHSLYVSCHPRRPSGAREVLSGHPTLFGEFGHLAKASVREQVTVPTGAGRLLGVLGPGFISLTQLLTCASHRSESELKILQGGCARALRGSAGKESGSRVWKFLNFFPWPRVILLIVWVDRQDFLYPESVIHSLPRQRGVPFLMEDQFGPRVPVLSHVFLPSVSVKTHGFKQCIELINRSIRAQESQSDLSEIRPASHTSPKSKAKENGIKFGPIP